ncbi:TerC family protein [Niveibacterium sp. SC-1]|uniref:TerC family protein n=1 Tax=Niveibacterium sp. SC-1 TaxID=3135646 RepID=UPI00311FACF7
MTELSLIQDFTTTAFWIAVGQIILIDLVLSGDNAVVIALACRNLPPELRRRGIFWGVLGAVILRVTLTLFAAYVLDQPWLKLVGGLLLLWIGVKLLLPDDEEQDIPGATRLGAAVRTIIVADFVMSLDNVVAVAGASHGSVALLVFGLLVSIPLIMWSSQLIMVAMERYPVVVIFGAALLGWVAGGMIAGDPGLLAHLPPVPDWLHYAAAAGGALAVVLVGRLIARGRGAPRSNGGAA